MVCGGGAFTFREVLPETPGHGSIIMLTNWRSTSGDSVRGGKLLAANGSCPSRELAFFIDLGGSFGQEEVIVIFNVTK
jgi:hypothetical protein